LSNIVVFGLGEGRYGIPIEQIVEIIPCCEVTPVPGTPPFFEGFLNVRGELISLIDLRRYVGMEKLSDNRNSRILILCLEDETEQGVLVDEVTSIAEVEADRIQPLEENSFGKGFPKELLKGVVETSYGLVVILDIEKIISGVADKGEVQETASAR